MAHVRHCHQWYSGSLPMRTVRNLAQPNDNIEDPKVKSCSSHWTSHGYNSNPSHSIPQFHLILLGIGIIWHSSAYISESKFCFCFCFSASADLQQISSPEDDSKVLHISQSSFLIQHHQKSSIREGTACLLGSGNILLTSTFFKKSI